MSSQELPQPMDAQPIDKPVLRTELVTADRALLYRDALEDTAIKMQAEILIQGSGWTPISLDDLGTNRPDLESIAVTLRGTREEGLPFWQNVHAAEMKLRRQKRNQEAQQK